MKELKFRCRLLSDVIVSQSAATEGSHSSLCFIPGSNFMGIVASCYDSFTAEQQVELFHSGRVRFGDAHPVAAGGDRRSLHIPASFFCPKQKSVADECYVHHFITGDNVPADGGVRQQLKQCRDGFYCFDGQLAEAVPAERFFSLKSAYDRERRRSADNRMFGYESLRKGMEFLFSVECDDDSLAEAILSRLVGTRHIGRSRTAQYGLVEISECSFVQQESSASTFSIGGCDYITVYADGRLIFIDESGSASLRPTARQFGIDGDIDWEKSEVRTFQYAPWNGKRQTRDADRIGFEKGSVFVIRVNGSLPRPLPAYVGSYRSEGFGKVIYGWQLLQAADATGRTELAVSQVKSVERAAGGLLEGSGLLDYLAMKKREQKADDYIYGQVNDFVGKYRKIFPPLMFASQWGTIRGIAMQNATLGDILKELYDKTDVKSRNETATDSRTSEVVSTAYLTHGIAAKKWSERGRKEILRDFICMMGDNSEFGDLSQRALVNLSSRMAKK